MSEGIGEVGETRGEIEIDWRIANFFSDVLHSEKGDEFNKSPEFIFLNSTWRLIMKVSPACNHSSTEWIGLYIMKEDSGPPLTVEYSLGLKIPEGKTERLFHGTAVFTKYIGRGTPSFFLQSDLVKRKTEVGPSDILTVTCSLKRNNPNVISRTEKLSQDLMNLMVCGDDSDVTISVRGAKYSAHRNILGARSPVFSSMFKHEMTEKATGNVDIDDCDTGTFQTFLKYVYTGTVENLSRENLCALYEVADKYQVDELKKDCLEGMKTTLSVDKFCDVFTLALKHDEGELRKLATDFFYSKTDEITASVPWKAFSNENPTQANDLLIKKSS